MRFVIFLLLLIPNLSHGCFAGPQPAPGYGLGSVPYITDYANGNNGNDTARMTDLERDELVWDEMGYFSVSPSGWGEIKQISEQYYRIKVSSGGPGSCGPESVYVHRTFLNGIAISLTVAFLLVYLCITQIIKRKKSQV